MFKPSIYFSHCYWQSFVHTHKFHVRVAAIPFLGIVASFFWKKFGNGTPQYFGLKSALRFVNLFIIVGIFNVFGVFGVFCGIQS